MKMNIRIMASAIIVFVGLSSFAQTKTDAVNAYNNAVTLASTNLPEAINAMKEAADLATKAGAEADTVRMMAEQQIPALQYNYATALFKEKKIDEAINNFITARDLAVQYKDNSTQKKAEDLLPQLYLSKGINEYKASQFDAAASSFTKAIEYDSTVARAYLNLGLAYNKLNKNQEMTEAMDKAIEKGLAGNDEKTVETARKTMSNDLLVSANAAFKKNDHNTTAAQLEKAMKYNDTNPEILYLYAVVQNKLSHFDEALTIAEKGLTVEEDNATKKARFWFEIGNAQAGKGDNGTACASYKKAAVGPFAESANYQIKNVLKCN